MNNKYLKLRKIIRDGVCSIGTMDIQHCLENVSKEIENLYGEGLLLVEHDYMLTGTALEIRVKNLFSKMDYGIQNGRSGLEDFVIYPPTDTLRKEPIVVEVKSANKPSLTIADLRQIDDYVFDLSGEEIIRKRPPNNPNTFYLSAGLPPGPDRHPTPHKGVLIFNGPISIEFSKRGETDNILHPNHLDFISKRNICVIPFKRLIDRQSLYDGAENKQKFQAEFWDQIFGTEGILK